MELQGISGIKEFLNPCLVLQQAFLWIFCRYSIYLCLKLCMCLRVCVSFDISLDSLFHKHCEEPSYLLLWGVISLLHFYRSKKNNPTVWCNGFIFFQKHWLQSGMAAQVLSTCICSTSPGLSAGECAPPRIAIKLPDGFTNLPQLLSPI